jgi:hypothetical protein
LLGLKKEVAGEKSVGDKLTLEDIDKASPFDGPEESNPDHGEIDWDEYIWEAVNQLSNKSTPEGFLDLKRKARTGGLMDWYPFKNKEVRSFSPVLDGTQ